MKRTRKHRIKSEMLESCSSHFREEEHDLAYYIHDRVELMHQVFSAIKPKDLMAFTPQCIRHLSQDNIEELCTEELLGISSKRLCAILDGAAPPSDTESSSRSPSPDNLETISLDSISSDEEILSQTSSKKNKKHKHRRRESKNKSKKKKDTGTDDDTGEKSRASRAGLTVLELLELQARARAIRAQLQQEQAAKKSTEAADSEQSNPGSSDDEVLLKEEPPEVVEISSDEEKPSVEQLEKEMHKPSKDTGSSDVTSHTVTKRINDLIITVPQTKPTRKIKLNRTKSIGIPNSAQKATSNVSAIVIISAEAGNSKTIEKATPDAIKKPEVPTVAAKDSKTKEKLKKKKGKIDKKKKALTVDKEVIDHDEIMLQLSDSEKLDLLEDFDRKNYDTVTSSSSEDSESSSEDSDAEKVSDTNIQVAKKTNAPTIGDNVSLEDVEKQTETAAENLKEVENTNVKECSRNDSKSVEGNSNENTTNEVAESDLVVSVTYVNDESKINNEQNKAADNETEKSTITDCPHEEVTQSNATEEESQNQSDVIPVISKITPEKSSEDDKSEENVLRNVIEKTEEVSIHACQQASKEISEKNVSPVCQKEKNMSEGELSDRDSSEVEATELKSEVVCISDDEVSKSHKKKKHKKKEKKNKKEKKCKKSKSDFREACDENFYKESINDGAERVSLSDDQKAPESIVIDDEDVYEILELSDDSSCYEVEGTVLSKEPTAEEIEALSARIDEIKREDVVTEEEIHEHERREAEKNMIIDDDNNVKVNDGLMSWKDRYVSSKKVKKVLSTSNIFNALRKKNKDLKKKLEESKIKETQLEQEKLKQIELERIEKELEAQKQVEGSVQFYNTLESSTKYVDPVKEPVNKENSEKETQDKDKGTVTKEMKKDAKQLLKMYKRLLKYNDMDKKKEKDPNKKKKKKQKKKGKDDATSSVANAEGTNGV